MSEDSDSPFRWGKGKSKKIWVEKMVSWGRACFRSWITSLLTMLAAALFIENCSKFNITCLEMILNGLKNSLTLEMPVFPVISLRCQQEKQCSALISVRRWHDVSLLQYSTLENFILSSSVLLSVSYISLKTTPFMAHSCRGRKVSCLLTWQLVHSKRWTGISPSAVPGEWFFAGNGVKQQL